MSVASRVLGFPSFAFLARLSARNRMVALLCALGLLAGLQRAMFHEVIALLRETWHLSNEDLGLAEQANALAYGITLPLGGMLAHLLGPRRVLFWAGIVSALAGCGMGFAYDARTYATLCLQLGFAAGVMPAAAAVAVGYWCAPQAQGRALALLLAAPLLGEAVVELAATRLLTLLSAGWLFRHWQSLYLGIAALTVFWVVAFHRWYRSRPLIQGLAPEEQPSSDLPTGHLWLSGVMLRGGVLLLFAYTQGYAAGLGGPWLTQRLFITWHLAIDTSGIVRVSGTVGALLGCLAGGLLTDAALGHSRNIRSARQVVIGAGFLIGTFCLLPLRTLHEPLPALIWRSISMFMIFLPLAPLWTIPLTIVPGRPGPVLAILTLGTALATGLSPVFFANLLSWNISFFFGAACCLICGVAAFLLEPTHEIEKPAAKAPKEEDDDAGPRHH